MAYLQSSGGDPIARELIASMGKIIGLTIPEEDLEALSTGLRDQLASLERIEALDMTGIGPALLFDPRWHD